MADAEGVQQELQDYLHRKGINTLFINLVESLLLAKPDNPILHIIQYLQANYPDDAAPPRKKDAPHFPGGDNNPAEDDDDGDALSEIQEKVVAPKPVVKGRRTSVSAETIDPSSAKQFERVIHPKSAEEREGIGRMVAENILFKALDEKQHEIVLDAIFPKEFEPGEIIIKQGDDGDNFYILESGVCEVYKDDALVQTRSKAWALDRQTFKYIIMETTLKKREAHKGFIERVPLLESLSEYERLTVADALKAETFSDGEVIITQGDDGNLFYIIEDGTAVCTKQLSPAEPPVEMGLLTSGAYFGEIALLTTRPRQATVTAKGTVKCLTLDRKTFKRVMGPLEDILKRNIDKYNSVIANNI
ncbi:hypothetical protein PybrP1_009442 [[Pythium] brassicae (nom. inval.)]|nr:hypothetical protein PybrP1_009442 [[Pythium] brassicae (nom. inval.)]